MVDETTVRKINGEKRTRKNEKQTMGEGSVFQQHNSNS